MEVAPLMGFSTSPSFTLLRVRVGLWRAASEKIRLPGRSGSKSSGLRNSGFSIHNQVKIKSRDRRGRESLAQYILRSPFSLEKITYQQQTKTVLYRSKMNPVLKKNFAVFPVLDWIATLTAHIADKGEQLIRYYGYYSNVSRGKRKKEKPEDKTAIELLTAGSQAADGAGFQLFASRSKKQIPITHLETLRNDSGACPS